MDWGSVPEFLVVTKGEPRKIAQRIGLLLCCVLRHAFLFRGYEDSETIDVTIASFDYPVPFVRRKLSGSKINCLGLSSTSRFRYRQLADFLSVRMIRL